MRHEYFEHERIDVLQDEIPVALLRSLIVCASIGMAFWTAVYALLT